MTLNTVVGIAAGMLAVCALAIACAALRLARRSRLRCESLETGIDALRKEVELAASISVRTGRRVQRVESEYSAVADRVDLVESRAPLAGGSGSLDQAIEWARRGAEPEQLKEQFGLSSGEAELVARLHGRKESA